MPGKVYATGDSIDRRIPAAVARTLEVAERCSVALEIDTGRAKLKATIVERPFYKDGSVRR